MYSSSVTNQAQLDCVYDLFGMPNEQIFCINDTATKGRSQNGQHSATRTICMAAHSEGSTHTFCSNFWLRDMASIREILGNARKSEWTSVKMSGSVGCQKKKEKKAKMTARSEQLKWTGWRESYMARWKWLQWIFDISVNFGVCRAEWSHGKDFAICWNHDLNILLFQLFRFETDSCYSSR